MVLSKRDVSSGVFPFKDSYMAVLMFNCPVTVKYTPNNILYSKPQIYFVIANMMYKTQPGKTQ